MNQVVKLSRRTFSRCGFYGASIESIAKDCGISQPYVYALFGTKRALFIKAVEATYDEVCEELYKAARGTQGFGTLHSVGNRYIELLADEDVLFMLLQSFASCDDSEIRSAVRSKYLELWRTVTGTSGLSNSDVKNFMALGVLAQAAAAAHGEGLTEGKNAIFSLESQKCDS